MSLTRPKAIIRGGCCQHPEDCKHPDEPCVPRERWEDEQTAPGIRDLERMDGAEVEEALFGDESC